MPTIEEFGIELQPGSDRDAATRILNNDYQDHSPARAQDIRTLVSQGEGWANVYGIEGLIGEQEKVSFIDRLKSACEYFLADPARCQRQEVAMRNFYDSRYNNFNYFNLPFSKIQQLVDLDNNNDFIPRDYLVGKTQQSAYTRAHTHTEIDVQASVNKIYEGAVSAANKLKS